MIRALISLAVRIGCNCVRHSYQPKQKTLSRYETGASLPSIKTLVKIAKVLKKPAGYFLEEQGGKKSLTRLKRGCGP